MSKRENQHKVKPLFPIGKGQGLSRRRQKAEADQYLDELIDKKDEHSQELEQEISLKNFDLGSN